MKLFIGKRRTGKTTKVIKLAAKEFAYIVCIDQREVDRVWEESHKMKLDIPFPITFNDFLHGQYSPHGVKALIIDNADMLLQKMSRSPLLAISMTR